MSFSRRETRVFNSNRFKLGLFGLNCSGGITLTHAPERWEPTWDNTVAAAQLADEAGLEFLLPVARWLGHAGQTGPDGGALETLTWASGLLAATRDIVTFATVHVPLVHPIFAARQAATADLIGKGRFGLNVVSGWHTAEFDMFDVELRPHDERYAYTEEWLSIVRRIWSDPEPFEVRGRYFQLSGVAGYPKPHGGEQPLIMSAGSSDTGRAFAIREADCLLMVIVSFESLAKEIASLRSATTRRIGVYASGHVFCRPTEKETEEYYHYIVHERGDWAAADLMPQIRRPSESIPADKLALMKERFVAGAGTFPVVGSPDQVAQEFQRLSQAGLDGMAIGLVNYVDDFPILRDEVLPRMERLGLRSPVSNESRPPA